MNGKWSTYLNKITLCAATLLLLSFAFANSVSADDCKGNCGVNWQTCPPGDKDGKRRDISANCLKKLNEQANNCFDTMPVDGFVDRVPEDLCLRNRKNPKHNGMDYSATLGTDVIAAADGVVVYAACMGGYGRMVQIRHENKAQPGKYFVSVYAHLSEILVGHGPIKKGQPIGKVGGTGAGRKADGTCVVVETQQTQVINGKTVKGYGSHLHFELREGEMWAPNAPVINPMCSDVQALCGKCIKDFDPNKCRISCQEHPDDPVCKAPANTTPYNASRQYAAPGIPSSTGQGAVVKADNSRQLGNTKCNIETYRSTFNECIFCDLFRILFNTASSIAKAAYTSLSSSMVTIVVIGMALWLAMTILKFISAFDVKEPRILIKTILNQAFVVIIVVVLLRSNIQEFLDLTITPIFNTGMALAQLVTSGQSGETCKGFTPVMDDGGIPASMGNNILCTIQSVQGKILDIMTLGSTSLCIGFKVQSWHGIWLFPSVPYVIVGIILWLTAFLLMVIYPFLLIDSILQLSIASALIPVAIAAYAFPLTRKKYVGKVWETFMTAMFTFLFLSIVVFIITTGVEQIVGQTLSGRVKNAGTDTEYGIIIDAVDGLAWWGVKFLQLVFMMLLGWAVLDQAKEFAGSFSKGGFKVKDIGSPVGGMAANVATQAAFGVGGTAAKGIKTGGKMVGQKIHEKAHAAKVDRMANRVLNNPNATTDANGNMTAQVRKWNGRTVTRIVSRDAAGHTTVTNTRGKESVTTDKHMTITTKHNKDGSNMQQKVKIHSASCRKMTNRDGSINLYAVNELRQNSTHSANDINMAIMTQVLKERMPNSSLANMEGDFAARQIVQSDNNAFEILQTNTDGSTTRFSMNFSGDRVMTSVEKVRSDGSAIKYSSDGIIHKRSTFNYVNNKVDANSIRNKYAFADYYTKYDSKPMDANGRLSNSIPKDKIMFGQDDLDLMADQIAHYGQPNRLSEFSDK